MPLVAGGIGLGAFIGFLWGVARTPNRLAAVIEADRQLKLSELLGTALYLLRAPGELDAVARAVVATAEAQAATLRPGTVIVNHIGVRGWGTISLSAALAVTIGLITAGDRAAEANAGGGPAMMSWREAEAARRDEASRGAQAARERDMRRVKPRAGGDEEGPLAASLPDREKGGEPQAPHGKNGSGSSNDGTGGGAGHSSAEASQGQGLAATGGNAAERGKGTSSGGTGAAQSGVKGAGATGAGGSGKARRPAAVWASERWAADREGALKAVENGEVPSAYRELVRDYFERK